MASNAALLKDLSEQAPDHIAVTGDLTNLGLPGEYEAAAQWLERLGPPATVSAVPGNHDCTVKGCWRDAGERWAPWIAGDSETEAPFPFFRRRGPMALVGLSSAVPTRLGSAAGRLGDAQIARAARMLDRAARDGLFRVVLIHHSPMIGVGGWRKALRDGDALVGMLGRHGAELVLHGHHHVTSRSVLAGPATGIPAFGVPAALAVMAKPELAAWHLHRIERDAAGWRLLTTSRRYDPRSDLFRPEESWIHAVPTPQ